MSRAVIQLDGLRIEGWSLAGEETWFRVHPPGLALDAGRGAPALAGADDLLLSHGHLDHALGVPYYLSQRCLHHRGSSRIFCPRELAADLEALIRAAERMEHASYRYELIPLDPGSRCDLSRDFAIEAFRTDHGVASLGYFLEKRKRRLRADLRHLEAPEIAALRRRGESVEQEIREIFLAYCGDTGPAVFDSEPRVLQAPVLLLECTFLGSAMRGKDGEHRHLHLEEVLARADRFANRAVVLHHLSRRHTPAQLRAELAARAPALSARTHLLGEGT